MEATPHFSHYSDLSEAILAFTQLCRQVGLNVGKVEMLSAKKAATAGMVQQPKLFYYSLKAIYCTNEEDRKLFDTLFYMFWQDNSGRAKEESEAIPKARSKKQNTGSMMILGNGHLLEGEEESHNTSGANAAERLQQTDFSRVSDVNVELLEEIAEKLLRQMSVRLKRKMKSHPRRGQHEQGRRALGISQKKPQTSEAKAEFTA